MATVIPFPTRRADLLRLVPRTALDWLAPRLCAGCEERLLPHEVGFCEPCTSLLDHASPLLAPPSPRAALFVYGGPLADAIRRAKFGKRQELVGWMGRLLAARCAPLYATLVDHVVGVPLHRKRLEERTFDQGETLAYVFSKAMGIPWVPRVLRRTRDTRPQSDLDAAERARNVAGAFEVSRAARHLVRGRRILILDDVRTTGATLDACAQACMRGGAAEVRCLALAAA